MNKLMLSAAVLCTGLAGLAQNGVSAPTYIDREEGTGHCEWFGRHPSMRYQVIEGEFRNQGFGIRELSLRQDTRELNNAARAWTQVTISMAAADITKVGSTFSNNAVGFFTTVFQSKVDWPTATGFPIPWAPATWGDVSGKLRYPFQNPWQHTGQLDFLADFVFAGGVMANQAPWDQSQYHVYYLDGDAMTTYSHQAITGQLPPASSCVDPGNMFVSPNEGARLSFSGYVFAANYNNPSLANRLVGAFGSLYTAPNAPVIHAVGVAGNLAGVNIGADCNKLYVDLNKPWAAFFQTTTTKRGIAVSPGTQISMLWRPSLAGMEVFGQSAWANSRNGNFSLSQAGRMIVPARQPIPTLPNRLATLAVSHLAGVADIAPTAMFQILPAIFYRTR